MEDARKPLLISIVGPTAVGKTSLAIELAGWLECDIISADSRQFYRELNIGTAKPSQAELAAARHHFIDSHSITEDYNAGAFGRDAQDLIEKLHQKKGTVVAVGGSTLYLKALWEGFDEMPKVKDGVRDELNDLFQSKGLSALQAELQEKDPAYYEQVDLQNGQRIIRALEVIRSTGEPFSTFRKEVRADLAYRNLKIGLDMERELLFDRINHRMDVMIGQGLFQEAESLHDYKDHNALQTVGYSEIFGYLDGAYDREEAIRLLKRNSRRYAKRQLTWFRKYEDIHWFSTDAVSEIKTLIAKELPKV